MKDEFEKDMNEDIIEESESYPVMPLRNTVLFPQQVIPIYIGREKSLKLISELPASSKHIVVVAQEDGSIEDPKPDEMYSFGTLAVVLKVFDMPDNSKSAIVQGIDRVKILSFKEKEPYYRAVVQRLSDNVPSEDIELDALGNNLRQVFSELIQVAPNLSEEHTGMLSNIQKPSRLADRSVSLLTVPNPEKQEVLEELDVKKRVEKAIKILSKEIQRIKLGEEIQTEVHDEITKSQREYYLREQMKAIKRELGEDESQVELKDIEDAIKKAKMPEDAEKVALKELDRLSKIPSQSPEYTVSRTYLDWLTELPWSKTSEDSINVKDAKSILDKDHYGLEKVKERILEYLAVRALKMQKDPEGALRGPLLCFAGPPGVGKTSLGRSIARSMGREFVRISLGGVRDEAEIRGHRRTYIGALPGRIIQSLKKAGTNNPVFMLDEIDKLGGDFRGDPSSALLEVLDPEQNCTFADHYLEVDFDLSKVMFISKLQLPIQRFQAGPIIGRKTGGASTSYAAELRKGIIPTQRAGGLRQINGGCAGAHAGIVRFRGRRLDPLLHPIIQKIKHPIHQSGQIQNLDIAVLAILIPFSSAVADTANFIHPEVVDSFFHHDPRHFSLIVQSNRGKTFG